MAAGGEDEPRTLRGMSRALVHLAWPTMLSRSGVLIMALVDLIMIGRYATEEIAYAALGFSFFIPALVATIGLQFGLIPAVARSFGAGNLRNCGVALRRGLPWGLVTGMVAGGVVALSWVWLTLVGHEAELVREASWVALAIAVGLPLQILYVVCAFYLEATRRPMPGLVLMIVANLLNVAANWVLIYGNLGVPALGAFGSAISTSLVRGFLFVGIFIYIVTRPDAREYGLFERPGSFWGEGGWKGGYDLRRIGLATCAGLLAETGAFTVLTQFAGFMGTAALAAYSIAHNLFATLFMLSLGIASATAVLVGNAEGRDDRHSVILAGWTGIGGTILLMVCFVPVLGLFASEIAGVYTEDLALAARTAPLILLVALASIADGSQAVSSAAVRGLGDSWTATWMHVTAWIVIMIPAAWVLGLTMGMQEAGLVVASGIGALAAVILMAWRFSVLVRRVADLPGRAAARAL